MIRKLLLTVSALLFVFASTTLYAGAKNEGITCVSKGVNTSYLYDKNGRDYSGRQVVGNSYKSGACMGRCGGACGNWLPDAWTKDCLDHDICIVDQNGSNGLANDPNCGNEFNHAADDYVFGVVRGCRG